MAFRLATHRLTALTRPSLVGVQSPIAAKYAASSTRSYVTKQVSQQPGSENLQELKENAKDEVKTVTKDIASAIAGANAKTSQLASGEGTIEAITKDFSGVSELVQKVPRQALFFGAAGLLPYLGTSAATVYCARQASLAQSATEGSTLDFETAMALLHHTENIQVGYGAVILSFIGALHWGFEFSKLGGVQGTPRYLLGIAPVVIAVPTLLLPGTQALAAQWAAFAGTWWMDQRATTNGWTPKWYSTYRFWLTALVGSSILLTLGGANYFGPGGKLATTGRRLNDMNSKAAATLDQQHGETKEGHVMKGKIGGDVDMSMTQDAYVKLTNVEKKAEEERKQKEEAEQKEQEEKEKADKEAAEKKQQTDKQDAERKSSGEKTPGA